MAELQSVYNKTLAYVDELDSQSVSVVENYIRSKAFSICIDKEIEEALKVFVLNDDFDF